MRKDERIDIDYYGVDECVGGEDLQDSDVVVLKEGHRPMTMESTIQG